MKETMVSEGLPNRRRARRHHDTTCPLDDLILDSENDKSRRLKSERIFSNVFNLGMSFPYQNLRPHGSCHREGLYFGSLNFWHSLPIQRVGAAILVALFLFGAFEEYSTLRIHPLRPRSDREVNQLSIQISFFDFSLVDDLGGWTYPRRDQRFPSYARLKVRLKEEIADYGGLHFHTIRDPSQFERQVDPNDYSRYEIERNQFLNEMDTSDLGQLYWHDDELDKVTCHRPNWRSLYFPICNDFHEIDLSRDFEMDVESKVDQNYDSYRFNHGYYREAWLVNDLIRSEGRVLKTLRGKHEFTERTMLMVQRDAIVMERLTSSPRIINMYGHCGTSITVEPISYELEQYAVPKGYMKKETLGDTFDVKPQNDFDPIEKLGLALEMAETLAILHGYEGGVIVHDDVQLCQWLRTKKGTLVLGDFNRAEIMNWDNEKETYCTYNNGYAYGNWRSPEEFSGKELDEKIDIFSLGNNLYGLLTGLWVYYENEDDGVVQKAIVSGNRSFIDERYRSRSYAEQKLVEAIDKCWEYDPLKRIDIFELIQFLRGAMDSVQQPTGGGAHYPNQGDGIHLRNLEVGLEQSKD